MSSHKELDVAEEERVETYGPMPDATKKLPALKLR
jgi:hypothetical protein